MNQKPTIRALLFDLGGVILRTEDPQPRTALASRLGKTRFELEEIVFNNRFSRLAERGLANEADVWREAARLLDLPERDIPALAREFFAGDQVDPEFVALIRALRGRFITALYSNTWDPELETRVNERLGMAGAFDHIISSARAKRVKPDPESFELALEVMEVEPEATIFVDDNADNIAAANRMGIRALRFQGFNRLLADLRALIDLPEEGLPAR